MATQVSGISIVSGKSKYIAFMDECGDHSMEKIDRDFPLFVLCTIVVERKLYIEQIIPAIGKLKLQFWDNEGINLHSREIRKAHGPFAIFQRKELRTKFLGELQSLMTHLPYHVLVSAIRKQEHLDRYGPQAINPYDLALTFTLERLVLFMEREHVTELPIIAEKRGSKEDLSLQATFYKLFASGTPFIAKNRMSSLFCPLQFEDKLRNVAGIQLADLCAYPSARHVLRPDQIYGPFQVVQKHICKDGVQGWKVFP